MCNFFTQLVKKERLGTARVKQVTIKNVHAMLWWYQWDGWFFPHLSEKSVH